ncbi:hypothetical protein Tco_0047240 [Tanacetum coccineum]
MSTMVENVIAAGADNRPPMLERSQYDSWQSSMLLYIQGKEHGKKFLHSVQNGPFQFGTIDILATPTTPASTRVRTIDDLTDEEKIREACDIRPTNIVLQGLPPDIYILDLVSCSSVCRFLNFASSNESDTSKAHYSPEKHTIFVWRDEEDMVEFVRNCPSEFKEYYIQMQVAKRSQAPLPSQSKDDWMILDKSIADQVSTGKKSKGLADQVFTDHDYEELRDGSIEYYIHPHCTRKCGLRMPVYSGFPVGGRWWGRCLASVQIQQFSFVRARTVSTHTCLVQNGVGIHFPKRRARDILNPFALEKEVPLKESLEAHAIRLAKKKGVKGKAILCGVGAAHLPRSDGVPVSVATVSPKDSELLGKLEEAGDAAYQVGRSEQSRCHSI